MRQLIRDRYEQLELLGHGGQGRVVRALDHLHSRTVALKLRPAGRETERDMLLREAGLLLAVPPHPNLPLVREDFFDEDVYCLVMDWVVGDNLSVVLASRGDPGLDPHHVVEWLGEIASALDHLHAHGVVHGDVKPSNCILGPDGQVVLVDLGVGTRDGSVAVRYSSRRYLAPEVAAGQPPTPASDIFGLSILAYMLLTGEVPDPTRPGTVPSALEAPLRRGLSIDPATRPASASELVGRLGHTGRQSTPRSMPAGRISFLFTDVEGSTQMLQEHGGKFDALIERHHQIVRRGIARHGGSEVAVRGDGFVVAFRSANDALEAALEMQRELPDPDAPPGEQVRVRMGLHVGEARSTEAGYVGIALNRASRVADAAFGGQVLLTQDFLDELAPPLPPGAGFKDLGQHRLRDLGEPERLFQLTSDHLQADFPPPRAQVARDRSLPGVPRGEGAEGEPASSQPPGNLRKPLTSFVGREQELEKLEALLGSHRLVTVTGPGGAGKTRVATEVVRRLQGLFPDGTWVVELGSLTEPELVAHQTARTLEVADSPGLDVVEAIRAQ
ncbi:MAG TPA: protein kinase, partial [Actinomycetota bacterium]|nr:protein kinase [Actinomycetota bacterium]